MRKLGLCSICGRPAYYTCPMCGRPVCPEHYDRETGLCHYCRGRVPPDRKGSRGLS